MSERLTIGIQGGPGSFNEEALHDYAERHSLTEGEDYDVAYMHTTEDVLKALKKRRIDQGIFALHNAAGGIVDESVDAMGQYNYETVEKMRIQISHTLMVPNGAELDSETVLITHPQVLSQCEKTLYQRYPKLEKTSGDGPEIDHALVAQRMAEGKSVTAGGVVFDSQKIATMGSINLAKMYGHTIVDQNMQDRGDDNPTSFMVVKRRKPFMRRMADKLH